MKKRIILIAALALTFVLALTLCAGCFVFGRYTITFDTQNGKDPIVRRFNAYFRMPKDPTWELWEFDGWYTDRDCTEKWVPSNTLTHSITVYAKWIFAHDFGDEYLLWDAECQDNDGVLGRNPSTNQFKDEFTYNFDSDKKAQVDVAYNAVVASIALGNDYDSFQNLFENYDTQLAYVVEQYQVAFVYYCAYDDEIYASNYNYIAECYNQNVSRYYGLFRDVYNSNYKDAFFEGWTEKQLDKILAQADSYGNSQYTEISNQIDALIMEYGNLMGNNAPTSKIAAKYAQLVDLNNRLAGLAGYSNYMDYAYDSVYNRYYTPQDVATMRSYVKQYIAPTLDRLYAYFDNFNGFTNDDSYNYYLDLATQSVFYPDHAAKQNLNLMGKYFVDMYAPATQGGKEINFYQVANDLMKNGNYYIGSYDGAYTYWIESKQTSVMYFSNVKDAYGFYTYQNAFTFVHEFGHYMNGYYNGGLDLSLDHDETHSQGNEMMFLAWLANNIPRGCAQGYQALKMEQLCNILLSICVSTAVDEFEQAAYTGAYNGNKVDAANYQSVFTQILRTYGSTVSEYVDYWTYVVFESAGYYISYAMSALPCVELYTMACNNFEAAKQSYFKLFTFSDDENFVSQDGEVLCTYAEILAYCGINNPFEEQLYQAIYNGLA